MTLELMTTVQAMPTGPNQPGEQALDPHDQRGVDVPGVRTETAQAVKPTPVSASATRKEFVTEKAHGETVLEYPIFGPDKFAKALAEQAKSEREADLKAERTEEQRDAEEVDRRDAEVRADPPRDAAPPPVRDVPPPLPPEQAEPAPERESEEPQEA